MKANCWYGKQDLRVENVPDPKILNRRDVILKVSSTAICGSDLHIYNGFIPTMKAGDILGHEFMGEVVEVGVRLAIFRSVIAWLRRFPSPVGDAGFAETNCFLSAKTRILTPGSPKA